MPLLRSNPRHEAFARNRALLIDVLEAYGLAGYTKGSEAWRRGNARKLDQNPKVRARIVELTKENEEDIAIKSYRMRSKLEDIGYADAVELWDDGEIVPQLKRLSTLSAALRSSISEIGVEPITYQGGIIGHRVKVKQHDKLAALAQLAKLLGIEAPSKVELTGKDGSPIQTQDVSDSIRVRALAAFIARTKQPEAAE